MCSSHAFVTIPVHSDSRTFEEEQKDLLDNLEKRFSHVNVSSSTFSTCTGDKDYNERPFHSTTKTTEEWEKDLTQWIRERRAKWDEEVKQMKGKLFHLKSDVDNTFPEATFHKERPHFSSKFNDSHSVTTKSTFTSTRNETSSTSHYSSSSTTSQQASNYKKGFTTACSSTDSPNFLGMEQESSHSVSGEGNEKLNSNISSANLYEFSDDGQMHFKVRFDVADYEPENIQVTVTNDVLTVKAKYEKRTAASCCVREMSRSLDLPERIDHEKLRCHLTKDGVLVVDAPLLAPEYKPISNNGFAKQPKCVSFNLQLTGRCGVQILSGSSNQRKAHVELPIDGSYQPSDISVTIEGRRILIQGIHEETSGGRKSRKQFSRTVEVSDVLDSLSVQSELQDGYLIVEVAMKP